LQRRDPEVDAVEEVEGDQGVVLVEVEASIGLEGVRVSLASRLTVDGIVAGDGEEPENNVVAPDELTYLDDPLEELLDGDVGRLELRVLL